MQGEDRIVDSEKHQLVWVCSGLRLKGKEREVASGRCSCSMAKNVDAVDLTEAEGTEEFVEGRGGPEGNAKSFAQGKGGCGSQVLSPGGGKGSGNQSGMVGSPVKRRRSSGSGAAAVAVDVGSIAALADVAPRERVNVKGYLMYIPAEARTVTMRASVKSLTQQEKPVCTRLLADHGSVVQVSFWGDIATRWQAPLAEALEAAEEGEWPYLQLECCEVVAVANSLPSLPLRKLQSTGGTVVHILQPGALKISPVAASVISDFSVFGSCVKTPLVVHVQESRHGVTAAIQSR